MAAECPYGTKLYGFRCPAGPCPARGGAHSHSCSAPTTENHQPLHDGSHDSFHCVSASQPTPSTHRTRVARAAARGSTRRSRCPGGPWRGARRATASAGCPCPPPGPPCAGGEDGVGVVAAHSGIAHPHTSKLPQQTATNCTQSVPPRHLRTAARAWPAVTLAPLAASIWMRVRTTSSGWTREAALDPAAGIRARWWTQ